MYLLIEINKQLQRIHNLFVEFEREQKLFTFCKDMFDLFVVLLIYYID